MAEKTIESLTKELAQAEVVIADLKDKLAKAESKEATVGFPVVKNAEKKDVEVLNAEFFVPKIGEVNLDVLKKNPELVSKLLATKSVNVRLKQ